MRTVEVCRSPQGFGFTISGQQPCILSCIVANSPADLAGLKAGMFLLSVNGLNVSRMPHEKIVQLIGQSNGGIWLSMSDNYYHSSSDSSDEDHPGGSTSTASSVGGALGNSASGASGGQRVRPKYNANKVKGT